MFLRKSLLKFGNLCKSIGMQANQKVNFYMQKYSLHQILQVTGRVSIEDFQNMWNLTINFVTVFRNILIYLPLTQTQVFQQLVPFDMLSHIYCSNYMLACQVMKHLPENQDILVNDWMSCQIVLTLSLHVKYTPVWCKPCISYYELHILKKIRPIPSTDFHIFQFSYIYIQCLLYIVHYLHQTCIQLKLQPVLKKRKENLQEKRKSQGNPVQ